MQEHQVTFFTTSALVCIVGVVCLAVGMKAGLAMQPRTKDCPMTLPDGRRLSANTADGSYCRYAKPHVGHGIPSNELRGILNSRKRMEKVGA